MTSRLRRDQTTAWDDSCLAKSLVPCGAVVPRLCASPPRLVVHVAFAPIHANCVASKESEEPNNSTECKATKPLFVVFCHQFLLLSLVLFQALSILFENILHFLLHDNGLSAIRKHRARASSLGSCSVLSRNNQLRCFFLLGLVVRQDRVVSGSNRGERERRNSTERKEKREREKGQSTDTHDIATSFFFAARSSAARSSCIFFNVSAISFSLPSSMRRRISCEFRFFNLSPLRPRT